MIINVLFALEKKKLSNICFGIVNMHKTFGIQLNYYWWIIAVLNM